MRPSRSVGQAEFLVLEYAEGDRLYVPVSQADRVGRYIGSGDVAPSLTRLGTGEWTRAKAKVRRSVRDLAHELMELYSAPGDRRGPRLPGRYHLAGRARRQASRSRRRPTRSRPSATSSTTCRRRDRWTGCWSATSASARPKSRCALPSRRSRTAGRWRCSCPPRCSRSSTTPPSASGSSAFPVRVEMLSRFRSEKEQRAILEGLANGSVDIVHRHASVGAEGRPSSRTSAWSSSTKNSASASPTRSASSSCASEVDVLTLTATPIPRTLHMGLVGVRDMSVLETAPEARLPVRTYVTEYDEGTVAEAILREIDRGGQVYYVNNRVQGIETIASPPAQAGARSPDRRRSRADARGAAREDHARLRRG